LIPLASPTSATEQGRRRLKELHIEHGSQVGERVRRLRRSNANINAALAAFEQNRHGQKPKIDEAFTISAKVEESTTGNSTATNRRSVFRLASFRSQQATLVDTGVELTFITSVDLYNEWQGTVIANFSDDFGLYEQDVHNMVITRSEYNPAEWTARYVERIENGTRYLCPAPSMFTAFGLGVPIMEQQSVFGTPAPLNLESWQFSSPTQEEQYYQLYPEQRILDDPNGCSGFRQILPECGGPISQLGAKRKGRFQLTSYHVVTPQTRSDSRDPRPVTPGNPNGPQFVGGRNFAAAAGVGCGSSAGGCGLASIIFAGTTFGPCFVQGCGASIIGSALWFIRIQPARR
jgi:hypothetical protein